MEMLDFFPHSVAARNTLEAEQNPSFLQHSSLDHQVNISDALYTLENQFQTLG